MPIQTGPYDKLDYRTLCDAVFLKLRDEILDGSLKPGQKLLQTDLAARFGISRMPVRDALRKLEAEGLVSIIPGRGAKVAYLDLEECQEVYRIREVLDGLAVELAAPHITDAELGALRKLTEQMEEASRRGDLATWMHLDYLFHTQSYAPCRSPRLLKLIDGFWNSTYHFRRAYCNYPGRLERAEQMHRRILTALEARDARLCGDLVREHIRESVRGILEAARGGAEPAVNERRSSR